MLTRCEDWPERLHAAVESARHRRFQWGEHDCLLWACDAVLAMTDYDMGALHRGNYDDEVSAAAWAKERGMGSSLLEIARKTAAELELAEVAPLQAMRGDVILISTPLGPALGIVIDHRVAGAGLDGLVFTPVRDGIRAWRI